jgi:uncharacterized protein (TIGR03067 family)
MRSRQLAAALALCLPLLYIPAGAASPPGGGRDEPPDNQDRKLRRLREDLEQRLRETEQMLVERDRTPQLERKLKDQAAEIGELRKTVDAQAERARALEKQVGALSAEVRRLKGSKAELLGAWRVVSVQEGGSPKDAEVARVVVSDKTLTFLPADRGEERVYRFRVNPAEDPGEIDIACGGTRPVLGIYRVERGAGGADRLLLCLDRGNAVRPLAFDAGRDSGATLWTLERIPEAQAPAAAPGGRD